ncbi:unnamed protein product, partial [Allacma fusca]
MNTLNIFIPLLMVAAVSCKYRPLVAEFDEPKIAEKAVRRDNMDERGPYPGGDMRLNEDQLEELKQGIVGSNYRWPQGIIPYIIDTSFPASELAQVKQALQLISNYTCIKFTPRVSQASYVNIVRGADGTGCWADVGVQSGKANTVNIQGDYPSGTCAI